MSKVRFATSYLIPLLLFFSKMCWGFSIWPNPPVTPPANVKEWLYLQVKVNPGASAERTDQPLRLEHVEIPAELLQNSIGPGLTSSP